LALIARAFDGLERHYTDTGRSELFRRLKPLVSSSPDATPWGGAGGRAGPDREDPPRGAPPPPRPLRRRAS
jgi:hypothetical protein